MLHNLSIALVGYTRITTLLVNNIGEYIVSNVRISLESNTFRTIRSGIMLINTGAMAEFSDVLLEGQVQGLIAA